MQDTSTFHAPVIELKLKTLRDFFLSGKTKDLEFRKKNLKQLMSWIQSNEKDIVNAIQSDLGKPYLEALSSEILFCIKEIKETLSNLCDWAAPTYVPTPLFLKPAESYFLYAPKGVVLILAPWNYPFQLCIAPLIAAISAGNTVMIKPSEHSPHVAQILKRLCDACFDSNFVSCHMGDSALSEYLSKMNFDHIFFTGSTSVGKKVMMAAAQNLTSVTLELGGKSPCIVDETASLKRAAESIVWGKFFNAGQTCIAPDFVLVHKKAAEKFFEYIKDALEKSYHQKKAEENLSFIINAHHLERLNTILTRTKSNIYTVSLLEDGKKSRHLAPSILFPSSWDDPAMEEEIFGPILPIIIYTSIDEIISKLQGMNPPLALYAFSKSQKNLETYQNSLAFGGACFNDTLMHIANSELPFGGVRHSGMGRYHGKAGFVEFSNQKSILSCNSRWQSLKPKPPFDSLLNRIIAKLIRYI